MHRKANKISCVFCTLGALLLLAAICFLSLTVQAASVSLTLICSSSDVSISGMKWNIYKVGERVNESSFELVGDFAGYHVSLTDVTVASQLQDAADTLENYAVLDSITPLEYSVADAGGAVVFESLEAGLYLLSGESLTIGDMRYVPSAVLIEITEDSEALDFTAYAKITKAVSGSTDELEGTTQSASDSTEEVAESGTAAVGASTISRTTSGGGSSEKLPQTGQLWWPVPVMSAGGLVMLVVGAKLHEKG